MLFKSMPDLCTFRGVISDRVTFRSFLDISLIASIASHLAYWADEDVSHFIISQLLARQRIVVPQRFRSSSE